MKTALFISTFLLYNLSNAQTFTLKSNDLGGQATLKQVNNDFGCSGQNISPQLFWDNAPADTKSFAVTIYDEMNSAVFIVTALGFVSFLQNS